MNKKDNIVDFNHFKKIKKQENDIEVQGEKLIDQCLKIKEQTKKIMSLVKKDIM